MTDPKSTYLESLTEMDRQLGNDGELTWLASGTVLPTLKPMAESPSILCIVPDVWIGEMGLWTGAVHFKLVLTPFRRLTAGVEVNDLWNAKKRKWLPSVDVYFECPDTDFLWMCKREMGLEIMRHLFERLNYRCCREASVINSDVTEFPNYEQVVLGAVVNGNVDELIAACTRV